MPVATLSVPVSLNWSASKPMGWITWLAAASVPPIEVEAATPSVGAGRAFVYELVLTAVPMFVTMAVATDTRAVGAAAAIAIGG